jgi:thioredoxin reductase (NADPH)
MFTVGLQSNVALVAPFLLLAQGVKFSYPPIPGLAEMWARQVWHCPYCHGFEVNGQRLLAVGDEIWVKGMSDLLPIWTDKIMWASVSDVTEMRPIEGGLAAVVCGAEEFFAQCVVQTTVVARDGLADMLGCIRNEKGQVVTDDVGRTNVEKVYAAGDQTPAGGQVNLAVAAGHAAAIAINEAIGLPADQTGHSAGLSSLNT